MIQIKSQLARFSLLTLTTILILSAMARIVSANLAIDENSQTTHQTLADFIAKEEIALLIQRIQEREAEMEIREAAILQREQQLEAAKQAIESALVELSNAERALEERMFSSDQAAENDITGLVAVYESMKPKDAAALFETMNPQFAAGFLSRMSPDTAATIFSNMSPIAAYAISALIAGRNSNAITEQAQ